MSAFDRIKAFVHLSSSGYSSSLAMLFARDIEKLLAVVDAARESEKQFKAIDDGFFTGQIPSEFTPVSIALRELDGGEK